MRAFRRSWVSLGIVALVAFAGQARAQYQWTATLSGPKESPANGSPGTGIAVVTLSGDLFTVFVQFSGLTAGNTASHIHCCTAVPFTGTAGVATPTPTFPGFPGGTTSGTYFHTFNLTQLSSYNNAFLNGQTAAQKEAVLITGLNAGEAYLNIHTTNFPGGEIRGFLVNTPEPASIVLMATGFAAVGLAVRRRRSR